MRCRTCGTVISGKVHRCTYVASICLDCNEEERAITPNGLCAECKSASTMWIRVVNMVRLAGAIPKQISNR